jgi:hypothetical protein
LRKRTRLLLISAHDYAAEDNRQPDVRGIGHMQENIVGRRTGRAASIDTYSGELKTFLDNECKRLNNRWTNDEADIRHKAEQLEAAISASYDIFD